MRWSLCRNWVDQVLVDTVIYSDMTSDIYWTLRDFQSAGMALG